MHGKNSKVCSDPAAPHTSSSAKGWAGAFGFGLGNDLSTASASCFWAWKRKELFVMAKKAQPVPNPAAKSNYPQGGPVTRTEHPLSPQGSQPASHTSQK